MSSRALPYELADGIDGGAQLQQVVPQLGAAIGSVRAEHFDRPTPCAAWTLRDLLNHVVGGAGMFADAIGGAPLRDISGRLPDVVGDDPTPVFERAAERFGLAVQAPGAAERVLDLPVGPMTVSTFLRFAAFDLTVHTWDVASVTGATIDLPDDLISEIESFARVVLESAARVGQLCGPPVAPPVGATALERLVAFSGRPVR